MTTKIAATTASATPAQAAATPAPATTVPPAPGKGVWLYDQTSGKFKVWAGVTPDMIRLAIERQPGSVIMNNSPLTRVLLDLEGHPKTPITLVVIDSDIVSGYIRMIDLVEKARLHVEATELQQKILSTVKIKVEPGEKRKGGLSAEGLLDF